MRAIVRNKNPRRTRQVLLNARPEGLEPRVVLSTGVGVGVPVAITPFFAANPLPRSLSIVGIDPMLGTTVTNGNISITVRFDRPIDPGSLGNEFEINEIGPDGMPTPIESLGIAINETAGDDGKSIVVTLSNALTTGRYDVVLLGSAFVTGLDGSSTLPEDRPLGSFVVADPGATLAEAVDLGIPIGTPVSVSDQLEPANPLAGVKLYKINLPETHKTWQVGLEVYSRRIGSDLLTTLALFDAKGNVVSTSQTGRPTSRTDPFLFDGVAPGIYYIGVSSLGNVPGIPGGYNPVAGIGGQTPVDAAAGAFKLDVVAQQADTPTDVKTFFLDYADKSIRTPTGFSVQFSETMNEIALKQSNLTAIKLVDRMGKVWTAHSDSYDEKTSTVTFSFDDSLPPNTYTVLLGKRGGLVNLANQAPVSPGYPAGTLAMFTVGASQVRSDPYDIGPLAANPATQGVARSVDLAANDSVTFRVVIMGPGTYDLQTTFTGSVPTMSAMVEGVMMTVDAGKPGILTRSDFQLPEGIVTYTISAGSAATSLKILFKLTSSLADQLLINGVGQSSALSLRLIDPSPISAGFAPVGSMGNGPTTFVANPGPTLVSPSALTNNGGATSVPSLTTPASSTQSTPGSPLLIAPTGGLVGHPSIGNDSIAIVGPTAPGGQFALAYHGAGLPLGMNRRSNNLSRAGRPLINGEMRSLVLPNETEFADQDFGFVPTSVQLVNELPVLRATPAQADGSILDRAAEIVGRWLASEGPGEKPSEGSDFDDKALAQIDRRNARTPGNAPEKELIETADLSHSAGIAVVAVTVVIIERKARRWFNSKRNRIVAHFSEN